MGTRHHGALEFDRFGFGKNQPSNILYWLERSMMKGKGAIEDGGHLAHVIQTNALSSHISSLRALLEIEQRKPADQRITQAKGVICERRTVNGKPRFFYRLEY